MPSFNTQLATARRKHAQWKREHLETFDLILSDDLDLLDAFLARESLSKQGKKFPTAETEIAELRLALAAIDKGDFSVYSRTRQDAERPLVVVEETIYDLATIRAGMSPSTALCYDAAVFNTLAIHLLMTDSFSQTYARLISSAPASAPEGTQEILRDEQLALGKSIKALLANRILTLEHDKIYKQLVDDPEIPESYKRRNILALQSVRTPEALRQAIDQLQNNYIRILADITQQKVNYAEAKVQLRNFLDPTSTSSCPTPLKTKGQRLLASLEAAESRQPLSLIALESSRLIYEFLAGVRSEIEELDQLRAPYTTIIEKLQTIISNPRTPTDFKNSASALIAIPFFDLELVEAKRLLQNITQEHQRIDRKLTAYFSTFDLAKSDLRTFLEVNPRLPNPGTDLLGELERAETTPVTSTSSLEVIDKVTSYLRKAPGLIIVYESMCQSAKKMLTDALQTGYLSDSEMLQGRELLRAFIEEERTTNPYDRLVALSEGLEKEALSLERQATQIVANLLQGLIDDLRIPASLKAYPQQILDAHVHTIIKPNMSSYRQMMQQLHDYTLAEVGKLVRQCEQLKQAFEAVLRRREIPGVLLAKGQELLSVYVEADTRQVPYDALLDLAKGLTSEGKGILRRFELYSQHRTASTALKAQLDNAYIPEIFKTNARSLVTQPFTATNEAAASELIGSFKRAIAVIETNVRKVEAACLTSKSRLIDSLSNIDIHTSLKTNGQTLLARYSAAVEARSDLDTLKRLADEIDAEYRAICTNHQLRNTYIERRNSLSSVIDNYDFDISLKSNGRRLVREFNTIESNMTSTMDELRLKADEIDVEREKIIARHAMHKRFGNVYKNIDIMRTYGHGLLSDDHDKGEAAIALSTALKEKIDTFVMSVRSETPQDPAIFESEFKLLLHSQDVEMHSHRHIWKPIVANILLALTGIGLIAIIIKAASQAIQPQGNPLDPNRTFNHSLFFAKTKTQVQLGRIEDKFNASLVLA